MADAQSQVLYQVIGPDGTVQPGAVTGPEWLEKGETLGPQIDTTQRGTGTPPALAAKQPEPPEKPAQPAPSTAQPASGVLSTIMPSAAAAEPPKALDPSKFGFAPAPATSPPAASTPIPPSQQPPATLDPSKFGFTTAPAQPQTPPPPSWSSTPEAVAGNIASAVAGIPAGVFGGRVVDYGNALMQTPLRSLFHWENPVTAFQESLAREQQISQGLQARSPTANIVGQVGGGLVGGALMSPYLGWQAAPTALGRIGQAASYLGRNALAGGTMGALGGQGDVGSDAAYGAALGSLFPLAHMAAQLPVGVYRQLAPLWSQPAREAAVAQQAADRIGASQIQTAPIDPATGQPVGPLDLAQATGNPDVAAATDIAPQYSQPSWTALRQQQQQSVGRQIGQMAGAGGAGTPASASKKGIDAIRELEGIADQRERELWSHPSLTGFQLPVDQFQRAAHGSLSQLMRSDPGLASVGISPEIRKVLDGINKLPPRANVQNINSFLSVLKSIVRNPPEKNPQAAAVAKRLLDDLVPALDTTVRSSGAPSKTIAAYDAARDFTRRAAQIFNTQDMRSVLAQTQGVFRADASEAMRRFFDFKAGTVEGPRNLKELQDFADEIKQAWLGRGAPYLRATATRDALRDSLRQYIAAALGEAANIDPSKALSPAAAQEFLRKNLGWMKGSGLFNQNQLDAADRLLDYIQMLRRPDLLRSQTQTNSATWRRLVNDKSFVGNIVSPMLVHLGSIAAAGHQVLSGDYLSALEALGGGEYFGGKMVATLNARALPAMQQMMSEILADTPRGRALLQTASPANLALQPTPIRQWLNGLTHALDADVIPQLGTRSQPDQRTAAPAGAY